MNHKTRPGGLPTSMWSLDQATATATAVNRSDNSSSNNNNNMASDKHVYIRVPQGAEHQLWSILFVSSLLTCVSVLVVWDLHHDFNDSGFDLAVGLVSTITAVELFLVSASSAVFIILLNGFESPTVQGQRIVLKHSITNICAFWIIYLGFLLGCVLFQAMLYLLAFAGLARGGQHALAPVIVLIVGGVTTFSFAKFCCCIVWCNMPEDALSTNEKTRDAISGHWDPDSVQSKPIATKLRNRIDRTRHDIETGDAIPSSSSSSDSEETTTTTTTTSEEQGPSSTRVASLTKTE